MMTAKKRRFTHRRHRRGQKLAALHDRFICTHPFGNKKALAPDCSGTRAVTPAVPPEFIRPRRMHFLCAPMMRTSLITGEAPVAPNGIKRPRIALVSPFNAAAAAAIPPSAALWERLTLRLLLLLTGFVVLLLLFILCRKK